MSRERKPVSGEGEEKEREKEGETRKKSWGGAGLNPWVQCVCPAEKMLMARSAISWPTLRSVLLRFHHHCTINYIINYSIPTTTSGRTLMGK